MGLWHMICLQSKQSPFLQIKMSKRVYDPYPFLAGQHWEQRAHHCGLARSHDHLLYTTFPSFHCPLEVRNDGNLSLMQHLVVGEPWEIAQHKSKIGSEASMFEWWTSTPYWWRPDILGFLHKYCFRTIRYSSHLNKRDPKCLSKSPQHLLSSFIQPSTSDQRQGTQRPRSEDHRPDCPGRNVYAHPSVEPRPHPFRLSPPAGRWAACPPESPENTQEKW